MDYVLALKKVQTEKPKENFMILEFGYGFKFVFPHKDGVAVMNAFANAECLKDNYSDPKRITEIERDSFVTKVMAFEEYQRFKIAALLNVTPDEVKEFQKPVVAPF